MTALICGAKWPKRSPSEPLAVVVSFACFIWQIINNKRKFPCVVLIVSSLITQLQDIVIVEIPAIAVVIKAALSGSFIAIEG